jgi:hypothetical protein
MPGELYDGHASVASDAVGQGSELVHVTERAVQENEIARRDQRALRLRVLALR